MKESIKKKISPEMIAKSYEIGKLLFKKQISLKDAKAELTSIGMNPNSAVGYAYYYSNLLNGKLFTRTKNTYATKYYLERIYSENSINDLLNALLSLSQHFDYYEEKSGTSVVERRKIYLDYLTVVNNHKYDIVYPDEVEKNQEFSEGKAKKVLVNMYERNPIARQICLDHFGAKCQICEFDFENKYGGLGKGFIHVHHKVDISTVGDEYSVDPINDLIPVCPNCHAMLHKRKPAYLIEEMKAIIEMYWDN